MAQSRLSLACASGVVAIPAEGRIAVWRPREEADLSALPSDRVHVIQGFRPDHDAWRERGYQTSFDPVGTYALSVVMVPRAKAQARALLAEAAARTDGPVVVDGQKTDGIDSILKACKARAAVGDVLAKAHGKLFTIVSHDGFADWKATGPQPGPDGFVTAPGVFSADRVDRGSRLLADALPGDIGAHVADLGAGWGYLASRLLERRGIELLHLVEAEHAALECARINVSDPRARFHWADATRVTLPQAMDAVVTNPPFHASRAADPELGREFVAAAARLLKPGGILWVVANRHLPYEAALSARFSETGEVGGDNGFKVIRAARPLRKA